ncbi:MAG: hypothetical protein KDE24_02760, partial [Caldilinea sp.]|nr:hypothetical protein [Caldilinea sp.]
MPAQARPGKFGVRRTGQHTVPYEGSLDQCDARRGLTKHPVDLPDLRTRLPEVMALWYTMRQKAHALDYLEAVIRYVTSASPSIGIADVRTAIEEIAPEGESLMGTIAQEWLQQGLQEGEQRGEQRGLRQGLLSGIRLALKLKFGMAGVALMSEIAQIE